MVIATFNDNADIEAENARKALRRQLRRMTERNLDLSGDAAPEAEDVNAMRSRFTNFLNACRNVPATERWELCGSALSLMNDQEFLACLPLLLKSESMPSADDMQERTTKSYAFLQSLRARLKITNPFDDAGTYRNFAGLSAGDCSIGYDRDADILAVANFKSDLPVENCLHIIVVDQSAHMEEPRVYAQQLLSLIGNMSRMKGAKTEALHKLWAIQSEFQKFVSCKFKANKPG